MTVAWRQDHRRDQDHLFAGQLQRAGDDARVLAAKHENGRPRPGRVRRLRRVETEFHLVVEQRATHISGGKISFGQQGKPAGRVIGFQNDRRLAGWRELAHLVFFSGLKITSPVNRRRWSNSSMTGNCFKNLRGSSETK